MKKKIEKKVEKLFIIQTESLSFLLVKKINHNPNSNYRIFKKFSKNELSKINNILILKKKFLNYLYHVY